jgi:hypothetical protein
MNERTGAEARLGQRFPMPGQPQVVDMLAERVLGRALDLSAGGLKMLVAEPLLDETLYQVRFMLPLDGGRSAPIIAGLQVLDQREDEDGMLCTGTRFIHLEGACARHIVHWLATQSAPARA